MKHCCNADDNIRIIKEYDPQPQNKDGSVRWFLYRWDDGKNGVRRLVKCQVCGSLYLVQVYRLNKFLQLQNTVFKDWYAVDTEQQADNWNRRYTGTQLEHEMHPVMRQESQS